MGLKEKKALVKKAVKNADCKENQAIVKKASDSEDLATLYGADIAAGNDGFEGVDGKSIAIPFLLVLQPLSKLTDTLDAKSGDIVDSIDHTIYKEIDVIPCAYQRKYVAWVPMSEGGGYRGEYDAAAVDAGTIQYDDEDGIKKIGDAELKDTRNHYVLYRDSDGVWRQALMSMTSSQIKKSKRWCSMMMSQYAKIGGATVKLPMWGAVYTITSEKEENDKGKWYGWTIRKKCNNTDAESIQLAKMFHDSVTAGAVKNVDYNQLDQQQKMTVDDEDDVAF